MASDSRTTRQLLEALGFDYAKGDHDSLVRAALRELEEWRDGHYEARPREYRPVQVAERAGAHVGRSHR